MSQEQTSVACARQAEAGLVNVRRMLLAPTPQSLDRCAPYLEDAANCLLALESQLKADLSPSAGERHQVRSAVDSLRRELARVDRLLRQAAALYAGWAHLLIPDSSTYTPRGEMNPAPTLRRISVDG